MTILSISEWQSPDQINYDELAKQVEHVIVQVQYNVARSDKHYQTHLREFQKRGIPCAVYALVQGFNYFDMLYEARSFYERAKDFNPTFYWLFIKECFMTDMRFGVECYRQILQGLSGQKVGLYIAPYLYRELYLDTAQFNGIWLPTYVSDHGEYTGLDPWETDHYDLHQFTFTGRLNGYDGLLNLSRLSGTKALDYFTAATPAVPWGSAEEGTFVLEKDIFLQTEPTPEALSLGLIPAGSEIKYDRFKHTDGHVWIRMPLTDGTCGYMATGLSDSEKRVGESWGRFK